MREPITKVTTLGKLEATWWSVGTVLALSYILAIGCSREKHRKPKKIYVGKYP